jgi:hypothetical protein
MNDWEKDVWAVIDAVTATVEDWVEGIEQTFTEVSTALDEEMRAEWQEFWEDWSIFWEDVTEIFNEFDPDAPNPDDARSPRPPAQNAAAPWLPMDWEMGLNPYLPATVEHQPACQGCQHYHGYVYSGQLLVCGMHPYGSEGGSCPDWEASSPN